MVTSHKEFLLRWSFFTVGIMIMSLGVVLMIRADLGSAPWDVLHVGLYKQLGLTIGTWSIIVGFCIIGVTTILTKKWPQIGVFINMLLVGLFIDLFMLVPWLVTPANFFLKLVMLTIGVMIIAYGIGLYISPKCGAGPRDSLMIALTAKTGWKVQWIRGSMEVAVLFSGWLLGGPVFIGTILFSFSIGSVLGFTLPQCQKFVDRMIERGVGIENINKGTLRFNDHDGVSKEVR